MSNEHEEHEQHDDERQLWRPDDAAPDELAETPGDEPAPAATPAALPERLYRHADDRRTGTSMSNKQDNLDEIHPETGATS